MPKIGEPGREQVRLREARAAWAEFEAGFARSRRGNLWRQWAGKTVSVFRRRDGYYGLSIADEDGMHHPPQQV
jgi:hypothetical protein